MILTIDAHNLPEAKSHARQWFHKLGCHHLEVTKRNIVPFCSDKYLVEYIVKEH